MPAGIPGEVNRISAATIEAQVVSDYAGEAPTAYGTAVIPSGTSLHIGQMRAVTSSDASVYGILVRPFPTGASQDALGTSTPPTAGIIDVLVRGYVNIKLASGTAVKGSPVYVWVGASSASHVPGDWVSATDSTNTIALANSCFMGAAEAVTGVTEVAFNI